MQYSNVYGDSDDSCFYYGKDDKIHLEYCHVCEKIINRKEAILQGIPLYRRKHKRLLFGTWDGVEIASQRFVDIYDQHEMKGLSFIALPKSPGSYLVKCDHIVRHDCNNENIQLEKSCTSCGRRDGAYMPQPYKVVADDEKKMQANHFYLSDIEFGDKHTQRPIFYATDGVLAAFKKETGRIFFNYFDDRGKYVFIDCCGPAK